LISATITKTAGVNASTSDTAEGVITISIKPYGNNIYIDKKTGFDLEAIGPISGDFYFFSDSFEITGGTVGQIDNDYVLYPGQTYTAKLKRTVTPGQSGYYYVYLQGIKYKTSATGSIINANIPNISTYKTNSTYLEYRSANTLACAKEGEKWIYDDSSAPGNPNNRSVDCCAGLLNAGGSTVYNSSCSIVSRVMGGDSGVCTKCGNGICEAGENKCTCPTDCNTIACAKEGETVTANYYGSYQGKACCTGLYINDKLTIEKLYNGSCVASVSGISPAVYTTFTCKNPSCGNGTCEPTKNEDICSCPTDCSATTDLSALKTQAKQLLAQFNALNCVSEMSYFDIDGATDVASLMSYIAQLQSKIASCITITTACVKDGNIYQWNSSSAYAARNQCCSGLVPVVTNPYSPQGGAATSYCSSKCGNGICDTGYYENYMTCAQDCGGTVTNATIKITPTNSGWSWPSNRTVFFSWKTTNPPSTARVGLYIRKVKDANGVTITNPVYVTLGTSQMVSGSAVASIPSQGVWEVYAVLCPGINPYCKPDANDNTSYFTVNLLTAMGMNNSYTANLESAIRQLQQQLLQLQGR
jgi:hypothetical protein